MDPLSPSSAQVEFGVLQGSGLAPALFLFSVSDFIFMVLN